LLLSLLPLFKSLLFNLIIIIAAASAILILLKRIKAFHELIIALYKVKGLILLFLFLFLFLFLLLLYIKVKSYKDLKRLYKRKEVKKERIYKRKL
jgi:nitrogen fixation/metabolism regulation signal transduction histidine kinase